MKQKFHIYLETTPCEDAERTNHVYVFVDRPVNRRMAKCVAYVPVGSTKVFKFSKPMSIDLKDRRFEPLD